jgi:hypothetical protein
MEKLLPVLYPHRVSVFNKYPYGVFFFNFQILPDLAIKYIKKFLKKVLKMA